MQNRSRYPSAMLQWRSVFERERGKKEEEEGSSGSVMGIRTIPPNPYQFISFSFKKKKGKLINSKTNKQINIIYFTTTNINF